MDNATTDPLFPLAASAIGAMLAPIFSAALAGEIGDDEVLLRIATTIRERTDCTPAEAVQATRRIIRCLAR